MKHKCAIPQKAGQAAHEAALDDAAVDAGLGIVERLDQVGAHQVGAQLQRHAMALQFGLVGFGQRQIGAVGAADRQRQPACRSGPQRPRQRQRRDADQDEQAERRGPQFPAITHDEQSRWFQPPDRTTQVPPTLRMSSPIDAKLSANPSPPPGKRRAMSAAVPETPA